VDVLVLQLSRLSSRPDGPRRHVSGVRHVADVCMIQTPTSKMDATTTADVAPVSSQRRCNGKLVVVFLATLIACVLVVGIGVGVKNMTLTFIGVGVLGVATFVILLNVAARASCSSVRTCGCLHRVVSPPVNSLA
jgi:hypothetical protein